MTVSPALLRALDIARLAERHDDDPAEIATAMIVMGARALALIGGRDAASASLHTWAVRVAQGEGFAEPLHEAGHA